MDDKQIDKLVDSLGDQNTEADAPDTKEPSEDDLAILEDAKKKYGVDKSHWDTLVYNKGREDLEFLSDDPDAQWNEKDLEERKKSGKPCITSDYLTQFVHQVSNNIRMNTPSINPIPVGSSKKSIATDNAVKGIIRGIEYASRADQVYDTGATNAVKCSIGYAKIDHDYEDDESFNQVLQIKRVINPFMIYPDSASTECDLSDQEHCTEIEEMSVDSFKKQFPEAQIVGWEDEGPSRAYKDEDKIRIAHFYIKEYKDVEKASRNKRGEDVKRTIRKCIVRRYRLSGAEVLQKSTFPGCYVPFVSFYGEEAWNDGKRQIHSLIRKAKQSQQLLNISKSVEWEILLKQPIAPVSAQAGSVENYSDDWLNPSKAGVLRWDAFDDEGRPFAQPQRIMPPQIPAGLVNAASEAAEGMKANMGLYNNAIGEQGQETSGKAINARKIQGDVATYHFGDNTVRAITQIGRIIVGAIPEIYDTGRIVRIMNEEEKPDSLGINGEVVDGQKETIDLSNIKYDVRVITGQSFTTRRQESADFYQNVIQRQPDMIKVCGDLMFENMDVEGAQAMAGRMKKLIPPELLADENGDADADPEKEQMKKIIEQGAQALNAAAAQVAELQKQLEDKTMETQGKLAIGMRQADAKDDANKIAMIKAVGDLSVANDKNDIQEQKNAGDMALKTDQQSIDTLIEMMTRIEAALNPQPAMTELPQGDPQANNGGGMNEGMV